MRLCLLLVLLLPVIAARKGIPAPQRRRCPSSWPTNHMQYLNAERFSNGLFNGETYSYSLETESDAEDGLYVPGMQHTFSLSAHEAFSAIRGFIIMSTPVDEDHCGAGIFSNNGRRFRTVPGCKHVIQNRFTVDTHSQLFHWTAPQCGCVKIRATVLTDPDMYTIDDDDVEEGALTRILCPDEDDEELIATAIFPMDDEYDDEDNKIPDVTDAEYYGDENRTEDEEDEEEEIAEAEVPADEVMDGEDDGYNADLVDEEGGTEEGQRRQWRRGRGKWSRRGPGMRRMNRKRDDSEESSEEDEYDGDRRRGSRRPSSSGNHGHGGRGRRPHHHGRKHHHRRHNMTQTMREHMICKRIKKASENEQLDRHMNSAIQNEAADERRQNWHRRRQELQQCCGMEDADDRHGCFEMTRIERMTKVCRAEESLPSFVQPADQRDILEECCNVEPRQMYECFAESMAEAKRGVFQRGHSRVGDNIMKIRARQACRKLEGREEPRKGRMERMDEETQMEFSEIWHSRRMELRECCIVSDEERLECLDDMRMERYDSVCAGEQPLHLRRLVRGTVEKPSALATRCCELEDEERYECFNSSIVHRWSKSKVARRAKKDRNAVDDDSQEESLDQTRRRDAALQAMQEKRRRNLACCNAGRPIAEYVESVRGAWSTCNRQAHQHVAETPALTGRTALFCRRSFTKCCKRTAYERLAELEEEPTF